MTLFTLIQIPPDAFHDRPRYGVQTLHIESGCIGGMGYYPTPERALEAVTSAYRTPLMQVENATYRDAAKRSQRVEVAV